MDELLTDCLLQAIKAHIKDKDLPIEASGLFAMVLRARRRGSWVDVSSSSFKKASVFLARMEKEGLLRLATKNGVTKVTEFNRGHPLVKGYSPYPPDESEGAHLAMLHEAAAAASRPASLKGPPIAVEELFRPHSTMQGVLFPKDTEAVYTIHECKRFLTEYIDKEGLVDPTKPSQLVLDPFLCDALFPPQTETSPPIPTHLARAKVNEMFQKRLQAYFRMSGGSLKRPSTFPAKWHEGAGGVRQAVCPGVSIRTEVRRGHNVTLVRGLELLGIDSEIFAKDMKEVFAAASSFEATPLKDGGKTNEVMFQGFWDKTLGQHLMAEYSCPKMCLEVRAKGKNSEKAARLATNVTRG